MIFMNSRGDVVAKQTVTGDGVPAMLPAAPMWRDADCSRITAAYRASALLTGEEL